MKDKTILIIDDEQSARIALERCLSDEGYDIVVAGSASTALGLLNEIEVDLIVSDWNLEDMSGMELFQKLSRSHWQQTHSAIPFIIITGVYTHSEDLEHAFRLGVDDYVQKPITTHKIELNNRVRKALIEHEKVKNIAQQKLNEENHRIAKVTAYENMIHSFKANIEEMIARTPLHKNKLYDLLNDYEREIDKLNNKGLIKEEVNRVFPGIFHFLEGNFPLLSQDDLLICACILLKESNPTIAHRFGMSDESFRKRKMRLKDKIGIPKGTDFYTYLRRLSSINNEKV